MDDEYETTWKDHLLAVVLVFAIGIGMGMAVASGRISEQEITEFVDNVREIWGFIVDCIIAIVREWFSLFKVK
jgi:hypothetical protein